MKSKKGRLNLTAMTARDQERIAIEALGWFVLQYRKRFWRSPLRQLKNLTRKPFFIFEVEGNRRAADILSDLFPPERLKPGPESADLTTWYRQNCYRTAVKVLRRLLHQARMRGLFTRDEYASFISRLGSDPELDEAVADLGAGLFPFVDGISELREELTKLIPLAVRVHESDEEGRAVGPIPDLVAQYIFGGRDLRAARSRRLANDQAVKRVRAQERVSYPTSPSSRADAQAKVLHEGERQSDEKKRRPHAALDHERNGAGNSATRPDLKSHEDARRRTAVHPDQRKPSRLLAGRRDRVDSGAKAALDVRPRPGGTRGLKERRK